MSTSVSIALLLSIILGFLVTHSECLPVLARSSIPPAEDCLVEPRTVEEMMALVTPVSGTPASLGPVSLRSIPGGNPSGAETNSDVWKTFWEVTACVNKGSLLQKYALYSDEAITGPGDPAYITEATRVFSSPATPRAEDDQNALVAIWDVQDLPDGRVGALVAYGWVQSPQINYVFFRLQDSRWLIDEFISEPELVRMGVDLAIPPNASTPIAA
jgi:hypothetical protein